MTDSLLSIVAMMEKQGISKMQRYAVVYGYRRSGLTLKQVGEIFGLTPERIRTICKDYVRMANKRYQLDGLEISIQSERKVNYPPCTAAYLSSCLDVVINKIERYRR